MGYMNKYIEEYINLKYRLYRDLSITSIPPEHTFSVNWISHYNNPELTLKLKNMTISKQWIR